MSTNDALAATCEADGCVRGVHAKNLCGYHYNRTRAGRPCSFRDCGRRAASRGLCTSHAWQRNRGKPLTPIPTITESACNVDSCNRRPQSRGPWAGMCSAHARHMREWGYVAPLRDMRPSDDPEKFWGRVNKTPTCWLWMGSRTTAGYGNLRLSSGRYDYAHRVSYRLAGGVIQEGMHLDHLCRNRGCVNPKHLDQVTPRENIRRGAAGYGGVRTECIHGHDITDAANVYTDPRGVNRCRPCAKRRDAARRMKRRAGHDS